MSYYTERQWLFYEDVQSPVRFSGWQFVAAVIMWLLPVLVG